MFRKFLLGSVLCALVGFSASSYANGINKQEWVDKYKYSVPFPIQVKHETVDRIDNKWIIRGIIDGENIPFEFVYANETVESINLDNQKIENKKAGNIIKSNVDIAYSNLYRFAYNVYKEIDKRNCVEITNTEGVSDYYNVVMKNTVENVPFTSNISFLPMLSRDINGVAIRQSTTYKYGSNNTFISIYMFKKINGIWNIRHPKMKNYVPAREYTKIDRKLRDWLLNGVLDKIYNQVNSVER